MELSEATLAIDLIDGEDPFASKRLGIGECLATGVLVILKIELRLGVETDAGLAFFETMPPGEFLVVAGRRKRLA